MSFLCKRGQLGCVIFCCLRTGKAFVWFTFVTVLFVMLICQHQVNCFCPVCLSFAPCPNSMSRLSWPFPPECHSLMFFSHTEWTQMSGTCGWDDCVACDRGRVGGHMLISYLEVGSSCNAIGGNTRKKGILSLLFDQEEGTCLFSLLKWIPPFMSFVFK